MYGGYQIAVAESCTGGSLASCLTNTAGSSEYFLGGIVAYDIGIKRKVLKVRETTLNGPGVYSYECVVDMAYGVASLFSNSQKQVTHAIATSGNLEEPYSTYVAFLNAIDRSVYAFTINMPEEIQKESREWRKKYYVDQIMKKFDEWIEETTH
jgi:PncC family amidohydrolase